MHVLVLPSWYPKEKHDTAGCFFREQAHALRRAGHQVGVLAPIYRSLRQIKGFWNRHEVELFEDDGGIPTLRVSILNIFPGIACLEAWNTVRMLKTPFDDYVQRFGLPDIVHLHSLLPAGYFARWLMNKQNVPFVVTEHSSAYSRGLAPPYRLRRARQIASQAKYRISVSRPFGQLLTAQVGADAGHWNPIPNIVSNDFFHNCKQLTNTHSTNPFIFLCIGSLEPNKRFDLALTAFAKAFSANPRYQLRIGGVGPQRNALGSLAVNLGIERCVTFLGALSRKEVACEMHNASVFVLSSDSETFGVVLVEALATGLPVVATACGGPEDIVKENNGLLVPPGGVCTMAEALNYMVKNYTKYDSTKISTDCVERFGEQAICTQLGAIYDKVLSGSPRRSGCNNYNPVPAATYFSERQRSQVSP